MTTVILALIPLKAVPGTMSCNIDIALLNCPDKTDELETQYRRLHQVRSEKDLIRLLIDKEIDLIVTPWRPKAFDKWGKIASTYHIPFLVWADSPQQWPAEKWLLPMDENDTILTESIQRQQDLIASMRDHRQLLRMQFILSQTIDFTNQVMQTTKDQFISETKSYFQKAFRMENCHWVAVKPNSSKLPPILQLKQELENQKVDQGNLIQALNLCSLEVAHADAFQIWKTDQGHYLVMLWVDDQSESRQCLILNKVQIRQRHDFEALLAALSPFLRRRWSLCLAVAEAQSMVYKDSLTSLYNQKFLGEVVKRKIEENRRYKTPFSVLFIDVDHFKKVNDSLGHIIGSGVLQRMGELLERQIRSSDFAFRYGGDEFIVLLSHTEGEDAYNVAERIRKAIENSPFAVNGLKVRVTVSIGLACFPLHATSAADIIRIADEAMYYGKHTSRNIVYKAS
jgi:diguanylate cyclase (GGDEF)-like protein